MSDWGIDLDYCGIEWLALEMKRDHFVLFETTPEYNILDSSVDYEGHSISSKGFLPTFIDVVLIWVKFAHSSPF